MNYTPPDIVVITAKAGSGKSAILKIAMEKDKANGIVSIAIDDEANMPTPTTVLQKGIHRVYIEKRPAPKPKKEIEN
jgi:ABC-type lipoprotein export system ATPase subunit